MNIAVLYNSSAQVLAPTLNNGYRAMCMYVCMLMTVRALAAIACYITVHFDTNMGLFLANYLVLSVYNFEIMYVEWY